MKRRSFLKILAAAGATIAAPITAFKLKGDKVSDDIDCVAAFSTRKVCTNYTGPIATLGRHDGKTMDLYGHETKQEIEDWSAGGDVYMVGLYDQSGNDSHFFMSSQDRMTPIKFCGDRIHWSSSFHAENRVDKLEEQ